jgi:hypothetical protein
LVRLRQCGGDAGCVWSAPLLCQPSFPCPSSNPADPYKSFDVPRGSLAPDILRAFWKRALLFNTDVTRDPTARELAEFFAVTRSFE